MTSLHESVLKALEQNYLIEAEAGRGGMGIVYRARDKRLDRLVAIKVLQLHQNAQSDLQNEVSERFQREARVLAGLSHPNLVTIYDVGEVNGFSYMIMEYVQGKDISELIGSGKQMPPALVASIAHQACLALAVAHENGIVHRDIKPANLMLTPKGQVKLMDFGIAQLQQLENAKLTQAGSMMGSILYASPEQLQDARSVDFRSDIYALGISLYEMLVGESPYKGQSLSEMMLEIMSQQEIPLLQQHLPEIPASLAKIIARAAAKKPTDRYASAQEMANFASELLAGASAQPSFSLDFSPTLQTSSQVTRTRDITLLRRTRINLDRAAQLQQQYAWVADIIKTWPQAALTQLDSDLLLKKVTERDVFGKGLSGCLVIDNRYFLLLANGLLIGALDIETHQIQQTVFYHIPSKIRNAVLYRLEHENILPVILADILSGRGKRIQDNLDSALMDLEPLIQNFAPDRDAFTGYVMCLSHNNIFYYGYDQGQLLFSTNALGNTFDESINWKNPENLVLQDSVLMRVFTCNPEVLGHSRNDFLNGLQLHHSPKVPEKSGLQDLCDAPDKEWPLDLVREVKGNTLLVEHSSRPLQLDIGSHIFDLNSSVKKSTVVEFSSFLMERYFYLLHSSGNANSLKYIYQWIPGIDRFLFSQHLKGEDGEMYHFDGVVYGTPSGDNNEKILFLIRTGLGDLESLTAFLEAVNQVKRQHIRTGDIGGAFYLSEVALSDEALALFRDRTVEPRKSLMGLGSLDKLTRYKGFVRIGMKRGYHLNLFESVVGESETSGFNLLAPLLH